MTPSWHMSQRRGLHSSKPRHQEQLQRNALFSNIFSLRGVCRKLHMIWTYAVIAFCDWNLCRTPDPT
eukprot:scaffold165494_cov33-Attheya_sp.AAC.1